MKKELTPEQKKVDKDLNIILVASLIPLIFFVHFGHKFGEFVKNTDINIWKRFFSSALLQFSLAGLGSSIVMIYRKEKFKDYGLVRKNALKAIVLSVIACIPAFIFMLVNGEIVSYFPFKEVYTTREFLSSGFPANILGYGLTALVWGFFEGFNYVVISKKSISSILAKANGLIQVLLFRE